MRRTPRTMGTFRDLRGGCYVCHGGGAQWYGRNALAVAAKHHDATGHTTWCEISTSVVYGDAATPPPTVDAAK